MFKDRRKTERFSLDRVAKIQTRTDALPRDCLLSDVSDGGARLHVEGLDVPDQFMLVLPGPQRVTRECRVAWRLGFEIGVEFVDRARAGFAQSFARQRVA